MNSAILTACFLALTSQDFLATYQALIKQLSAEPRHIEQVETLVTSGNYFNYPQPTLSTSMAVREGLNILESQPFEKAPVEKWLAKYLRALKQNRRIENANNKKAPVDYYLKRFKNHGYAITAVAFSPDGKLLVTGDQNTNVTIRNAETGRISKEAPDLFPLLAMFGYKGIHTVEFSPDGKWLAVSSVGYPKVALFNTHTWKGRMTPLSCNRFAFSPDSQELVCAFENTVTYMTLPSLRKRTETKLGTTLFGNIESIAISADKQYVAVVRKGTYNIAKYKTEEMLANEGIQEGGVFPSLRFAENNSNIVSVHGSFGSFIYDFQNKKMISNTPHALSRFTNLEHVNPRTSYFINNSTRLLTWEANATMHIYEFPSMSELFAYNFNSISDHLVSTFSNDKKQMAIGTHKGFIYLLDFEMFMAEMR